MEMQRCVRDLTHLGQGELDAPDLTLVAETVLAGELEGGQQSSGAPLIQTSSLQADHHHLDRSPRQTVSTACLVPRRHPNRFLFSPQLMPAPMQMPMRTASKPEPTLSSASRRAAS